MDVGDPSNFARILDLYRENADVHQAICKDITGFRYTDEQIAETMRTVYRETGYVLDPHGACGYQALVDSPLQPGETGVFLETAHPAKFKETVDRILDINLAIPDKLQAFMKGKKQSIELKKDFTGFKQYLLAQ
jgi:threonine synthase